MIPLTQVVWFWVFWARSHYVEQAGLELGALPASASQALGSHHTH